MSRVERMCRLAYVGVLTVLIKLVELVTRQLERILERELWR